MLISTAAPTPQRVDFVEEDRRWRVVPRYLSAAPKFSPFVSASEKRVQPEKAYAAVAPTLKSAELLPRKEDLRK